MLRHLDTFIPAIERVEALQKRIQMNGHFKHLKPPDFRP